MMFPAFIDPNLVRLFGYSSRSQKDKDAYVNLLDMRMKAKKGALSQEFLNSLGLTNSDLKIGLKLPLNAFTGTLRASFNKNADFKQGFGICTTGQLLILQLVYDLQKIPTLEMVSTNTDATKFYVDDSYEEEVEKTIHNWEKLTGLEMEKEVVVKSFMRDVNSYCEIVEVGDNDYEVHYKGGEFKGKHKFKWDKENKVFNYSFEDEIEANSMTIVSEALLKKLLFNIPIEDTINNCNDIFRFQIINHTGNTYLKCVQETENGDVELQKNNRIYASNIPNGPIVKIKQNGQRDTLALCPPNPIVDNGNKCAIDMVNKEWYIKITNQKLNDFLGIKRLTEYKKEELLTMTLEKGIIVDKKVKKADLIKLIEERNEVEKTSETKSNNINCVTGNRIGLKIGCLTIVSFAYSKGHHTYWNCRCDCGRSCIKRLDVLSSSKYKACRECFNKMKKVNRISDGDTKDDSSYKRLYNIWVNMKRRCRDKKSSSYYLYGAKGRDVCDEWFNSYSTFKKWAIENGYQDNLTIDRIDNNGNYCPDNCRWVTVAEQSRNTSRTRHLYYNNKEYCLSDLSKLTHIPRTSLHMYLAKYNNNAEQAVSEYLKNKERRIK